MVNTIMLAFELLFGCWHCNLSRKLAWQDRLGDSATEAQSA
jgi:hypothetical protein